MNTAIEFSNISKQYRLGLVSTKTLSHDLNRWWQTAVLHKEDPYLKIGSVNDRSTKGDSEYVWALKDIDFKVEQGDVVGIIGKNGAGKSTLLKLLSRVTGPTTGTIKARGRIGSLLEVGTGFHQEMTGRENIYMNGAILGMTKYEITRKLDEIVDFSGCERYIDTPVKRYSSGMMVRLGFAVAAHLDPEILVVDEVLAVGDAEFQKKAIGKMQDVSRGEGRTVLFVSHNMTSIKALCCRGILLKNGIVDYDGGIDETIDRYLHSNRVKPLGTIIDSIKYESQEIKVFSVTVNGSECNIVEMEIPNRTISIRIEGELLNDIPLAIECLLYDSNRVLLAKFAPTLFQTDLKQYKAGSFIINEKLELPAEITNGEYGLEVDITYPKVQYLVRFVDAIVLKISGATAAYGNELRYSDNGFLVLR